jgi:hypothetical protein
MAKISPDSVGADAGINRLSLKNDVASTCVVGTVEQLARRATKIATIHRMAWRL